MKNPSHSNLILYLSHLLISHSYVEYSPHSNIFGYHSHNFHNHLLPILNQTSVGNVIPASRRVRKTRSTFAATQTLHRSATAFEFFVRKRRALSPGKSSFAMAARRISNHLYVRPPGDRLKAQRNTMCRVRMPLRVRNLRTNLIH